MPDLCRVVGKVISPEHIPLGGATIQFSITPALVQPSRNGEDTLAPKVVETTLNHLGEVAVDLEPGVYAVTIALSQRRPFSPFKISVPDALTVNIADIQHLLPPAPPYMDEVRDILTDVRGARDETIAAAGDVDTKATEAAAAAEAADADAQATEAGRPWARK